MVGRSMFRYTAIRIIMRIENGEKTSSRVICTKIKNTIGSRVFRLFYLFFFSFFPFCPAVKMLNWLTMVMDCLLLENAYKQLLFFFLTQRRRASRRRNTLIDLARAHKKAGNLE
ncbi:uncharacterized protein GGS25DRAFT_500582 [Hypoxylon fragiforme]|uniref:uncharacterized protein n=1 Tax=Hypoxylon fragiforme TaxID=63214 RepID=UPI0020C6F721|nr:uncharacterized protein GGS25DRAFT_500582 [Hypoxylon fragiforme]KAI2606296.1 hypothetical protein GGS25DRAFT_500582 [Hypoxylon fragiforme]